MQSILSNETKRDELKFITSMVQKAERQISDGESQIEECIKQAIRLTDDKRIVLMETIDEIPFHPDHEHILLEFMYLKNDKEENPKENYIVVQYEYRKRGENIPRKETINLTHIGRNYTVSDAYDTVLARMEEVLNEEEYKDY